ncbi:OLC1v1033108C4 [Oldenlandia corymbosa var. corymbosa]|uniref:OLC1v1033108C4 n=1 Tax=Oldenlandia corymbosa var. corymbosa TaxID=529605 RepID=A0AAV1CML9_OLDCO|nr:OLC1v1033108C4 [Oldenlandia corymbosa var. corymbosa]
MGATYSTGGIFHIPKAHEVLGTKLVSSNSFKVWVDRATREVVALITLSEIFARALSEQVLDKVKEELNKRGLCIHLYSVIDSPGQKPFSLMIQTNEMVATSLLKQVAAERKMREEVAVKEMESKALQQAANLDAEVKMNAMKLEYLRKKGGDQAKDRN